MNDPLRIPQSIPTVPRIPSVPPSEPPKVTKEEDRLLLDVKPYKTEKYQKKRKTSLSLDPQGLASVMLFLRSRGVKFSDVVDYLIAEIVANAKQNNLKMNVEYDFT